MHNLSDITIIHYFQSKNYLLECNKPALVYPVLSSIDHVRETILMHTDIS